MPPAHHERSWPDKILFASILLLTGSLLGLVFDILRLAGASIGESALTLDLAWPAGVTLVMEALAALAAGYSAFHQSARYLLLGGLIAIASLGFMLLVPLFAFVSLLFIVKALIEGEEIKHDDRRVEASEWPDKAFSASIVLAVGGLVTLFHAIMVMTGRNWTWLPGTDTSAGLITLVAALVILWAARQCFHLRRSWAGWMGAVLCIFATAYTVIGPIAGIAAMVMLTLADREEEFLTPSAA